MIVDIVLPIYNPTDKVFCAIDSVINQTADNWHLIVIDDASENNLLIKITNRYKNIKDKISIIALKRNLRAAGARNYAISKSTETSAEGSFETSYTT